MKYSANLSPSETNEWLIFPSEKEAQNIDILYKYFTVNET